VSAATLRRARPWLGTLVEIRAEGLDDARGEAAVERAFAEVAAVHRLMSFHQPDSDLNRLHRAGVGERIRVDARTQEVLGWALRIAESSGGRFDPTIAAEQVRRGGLPRPRSTWWPEARVTWRDIELCGARHVCLLRPCWIDLGGIAKGYAVDRAIEILVDAGATRCSVNAGGDLRVAGAPAATVHVRLADGSLMAAPVELQDAALATSSSDIASDSPRSAHLDGVTRQPVGGGRTASVAAARCIVADALTKVVLAGDDVTTQRVLDEFAAQAYLLSGERAMLIGVAA
jgi:thiamine biosynthesis lipoprotein